MISVFPYLALVNNPNENVRAYMTMALVDDGTFCIDGPVRRFGWINDMARVPQKDGTFRYYSVKAPAVSYAGVPVYWALSRLAPHLGHPRPTEASRPEERAWWLRTTIWVLRLFAVQLPCFAFLVLFERWLRDFTSDVILRLSAVASVGLGTNYLAYTLMYTSHALFAVAAFSAFAIAERELRKSPHHPGRRRASMAFLAGFCAGWAVLLEYHALPAALVLALFAAHVFRRPTRLLALAAGGLLHVGAMMGFQYCAYGNPLTPGHKMVENATFAAEHEHGLFGIMLPSLEALGGISFNRGYGFFGMSPYMLLGLLALPLSLLPSPPVRSGARRPPRQAIVAAVLAMAALWFASSGFIHWRGGWTLGARYLGAAPPFFALGAVCLLAAMARRGAWARALARGLGCGLAIAGVLSIGLVGLVYNTLPEAVSRPLTHFAWPLIRTGFVPHHILEWLGVEAAWPWYVAAACLVGAPLLVALARQRERPWHYTLRAFSLLAALALGMFPALGPLSPEEATGTDLRWFTGIWEPQGRDSLSLARAAPGSGCEKQRLARMHRILGMDAEAAALEASSPMTRQQCGIR